jgi:mannose-1-phosphate guanylyltransferase
MQSQPWAVVLAADTGNSLSTLTSSEQGGHVPKQFCSLNGGPSLLELAVARASSVVPAHRVCVVVAREHEHWWKSMLDQLPAENVIVQPRDRGNGNSVLLALIYLLKCDPKARLIFLPADHHVLTEDSISAAMQAALAALTATSKEIYLLGIEPDEPEDELAYIVPQEAGRGRIRGVRHFIEKPSRSVAGELIREGGLWNSLILAVNGIHLMQTFKQRCLGNAMSIQAALAKANDPSDPPWALTKLYERIPDLDFSRPILQHDIAHLRVIAVPRCGWSDLRTPRRVSERVQLLSHRAGQPPEQRTRKSFLDLADAVKATAKCESDAPPALL